MRTALSAAASSRNTHQWPVIGGITQCLNFVTWMYDKAGTGYGSARAAWEDGRNIRHGRDVTPLVGAIGYFGGGPYGDVAIWVGDGWRGVDARGNGGVVTESTAQRERSTGNTYKGWLGSLAGHVIDFTDAASGAGRPIPIKRITEEDTMFTASAPNRGTGLFGGRAGYVSLSPVRDGEEVKAAAMLASIDFGMVSDERYDTLRDLVTRPVWELGK